MRIAKSLIVILLGILATSGVSGSSTSELAHRSWTRRDGAPTFVVSLAQDKAGFLWVGSADGLFRFDGTTFLRIAPPPGHPRVAVAASALAAAPNGDIWVGYAGRGGVARLRDGVLTDMHLPGAPSEILDIAFDNQGRPWVSAGDGTESLMRWTGKRWFAVHSPSGKSLDSVLQTHKGPDGTMWVLTTDALYYQSLGERLLTRAPLSVQSGATVLFGPDGRLWMTDDNGTRVLPPYDTGANTKPSSSRGRPPSHGFLHNVIDARGRLWVSTSVNGIYWLDVRSDTIHRLTERNGLSSDRTRRLLVDRSGAVWVGTDRGLDRYARPTVVRPPELPRNDPDGYEMAADRNARTIYISAGKEIWQVRPNMAPKIWARLPEAVKALCGATATSVVAGYSGGMVHLINGVTHRRVAFSTPETDQLSCAQGDHGRLLVAGDYSGFMELRHGRLTPYPLRQGLFAPSAVGLDARERPILILGRRDILRLDGTRASWWRGEQIGFERPNNISPLGTCTVISGFTGLLRLCGDQATKLDISDHPWLRDVKGIAVGTNGQVYILGHYGIFGVSAADLAVAFLTPRKPLAHYIVEDDDQLVGVPQRIISPEVIAATDGRIWILTRQGVLSLSPIASPATERPYAYIRSLGAGGKRYSQSAGTELPHGVSEVSVDFGALDLATPLQRRFRVALVGLDDRWTELGQRRQITFAHLGPGDYRFTVETDDRQGRWIEPGATVSFSIAPAFWQTRWFMALAVLSGILPIWLAASWRANSVASIARRRLEGRMAERERIARELHDTLLQGFQGLLLRFQAVAERLPIGQAAHTLINTTLDQAETILVEGRERVRYLRMGETTESLPDLLVRMADQSRLSSTAALDIVVEGRPVAIHPTVRDELGAVAGEAIRNAFRHADASFIEVQLTYRRTQLRLMIRDDGTGIPTAIVEDGGREGHYGLTGMRERATTIGGKFHLASSEGQGTEIVLQIPGRLAYLAENRSWLRGWGARV